MPLIQSQIFKFVLSNGLMVLVNPMHNVPKVTMELWYHVGSKDEKTGEKGMAHLIEHMIFKGTQKLSESDINVITHKLSGYTNAFTSHDATGYVYQFPTQHWQYGFDLLADCMRNARFDEQMLNSELKAVIQELKMRKDNYVGTVIEELISAMFLDHPYHYPIIGFKQDLWNLKRQTLVDFYKKHYVPNNATLVVVGDVDPQEVFKQAEKSFGHIKADKNYKREAFYHGKDLISKSVVIARDVKHPQVVMAACLPGFKEKKQYVFDVLSKALGSGKSSRLYKKLVDELQVALEVQTFTYELEDATPFFIYFEPKNPDDIEKIIKLVHKEVETIIKDGFSKKEIESAVKRVKTGLIHQLEKQMSRVDMIAKSYLFTKDENFIFNYTDYQDDTLQEEIKTILVECFSPSIMHIGKVVPLSEQDKQKALDLQELSDQEDAKILNGRTRSTQVEPPCLAQTIEVKKPLDFEFKKAKKAVLKNGLELLIHDNNELPKIDITLLLDARFDADPEELQGLYDFICHMAFEGTKDYPGTTLTDQLQQNGIHLSISPGRINMSMLSQDFEKGLELMYQVLQKLTFEQNSIEKIRTKLLTDLKYYWDHPSSFAGQLVKEKIYNNHPYAKNEHGTVESLQKITQKDLQTYYKQWFTPKKARMAIVGDLQNYNVVNVLEKYLSKWDGPTPEKKEYPKVADAKKDTVDHFINRDQIVLIFAKPSINRLDKNYDKLSLFEEIFSGGSMASKLFQLREQSGLFYSISGSLAARADHEPGFFAVQTLVSKDRLKEAEVAIKKVIDTVVDSITQQELDDAKQVFINSQVLNFATNNSIANAFLFIEKYNFSPDYFDKKIGEINAITLEQVKTAAAKFLNSHDMITFKIGRV